MAAPSIQPIESIPNPKDSPAKFDADAFAFTATELPRTIEQMNDLVAWLNENINVRQPVTKNDEASVIDADESGRYLRMSFEGAKTITVNPESITPQQHGAYWLINNIGAGDLSFVEGDGVTINNNVVVESASSVFLQRVSENVYDVVVVGGSFTADLTALENEIESRIVGPESAEDDQLVMFDGITGKQVKAGQTLTQVFNGWLVQLYNIFPRTVNTYADIATTPLAVGQIIKTKGHTVPGIGGLEFIGTSGSVVDNGGTKRNSATNGVYAKALINTPINPLMFGAVADGSTNDLLKIQSMFTAVSDGYREFDFLGKSYFLGSISVHEASKFRFVNINNLYISGNPTFSATNQFATQDIRYESIFEFVDCSNVYVECNGVSTIDETVPQPSGLICVNLINDTINCGNIEIKASLYGGVAALHSVNSWGISVKRTPERPTMRNIRAYLHADTVKYGTRLVGCGFDAYIVINSRKVTRSYFNVGCNNHIVEVNSTEQRLLTDVLIKSYRDNVRNINVTLNQIGSTSAEDAFSIEHDNLEQDTNISNITINANIFNKAVGAVGQVGAQYALGGPLQSSTTSGTKNIRINMNVDPSVSPCLKFPTTPASPSNIYVSSIFEPQNFTTNGFTIVKENCLSGSSSGSQPVRLSLSDFISSDGSALVNVYCTNDFSELIPVNRVAATYLLTFYKVSSGAGAIASSTLIQSSVVGVPPVISFSVSSGALIVSSDQSNPSARLSASATIIGTRFL